jgi:hypothetical protein
MRISRRVGIFLISSVVLFAIAALTLWMNLPRIARSFVGFHQKSVARSLAMWGRDASQITNDASAIHAAEMIGYITAYYVPGEGYRGPAAVEAEMEKRRRESIATIATSLERYTGLNYGANVDRWMDWAKKQGSTPDGRTNSNAGDQ